MPLAEPVFRLGDLGQPVSMAGASGRANDETRACADYDRPNKLLPLRPPESHLSSSLCFCRN